MTQKSPRKTVIVTWTEDETEFIGPEARVDLGERRKTRPVKTAKAVLWKASGSEKDVEKAVTYAASQGSNYAVFTYPASSSDSAVAKWKERARQDALSSKKDVITAEDIFRNSGMKR